jgi:hypothetical protein
LQVEVVVLKLTPRQQAQVSRTHVLTLTRAQRAKLLRRAKGCPNDLQVLTNRYDDCTCGMSAIAVWIKPGEVEVPMIFLPTAPLTPEELEEAGGPASPVDLAVDETLQLWIQGRAATMAEFQAVLLRWRKDLTDPKRRNEEGQLVVYLATPPVLPQGKEARLKQLIAQIRAFTERNRIDLFVSGFRAPGQ